MLRLKTYTGVRSFDWCRVRGGLNTKSPKEASETMEIEGSGRYLPAARLIMSFILTYVKDCHLQKGVDLLYVIP